MIKIHHVVAITLLTLFAAAPSYAGTYEKTWLFGKDEVQTFHPNTQGSEVGCEAFWPRQVSFEVKVIGDTRAKREWMNINDKPSTETSHIFNNVSSFSVGFFPGFKYELKNITGGIVFGLKCSSGVI